MKKKLLIIGDDFLRPQGVVNYTHPLAKRLSQKGHEVHYFCSGSQLLAYDLLFVPRLRRIYQDNIHYYKIINSPLYADVPGSPEADLSQPVIERMFRSVLTSSAPDIVYVDSLHGLPSRILEGIGQRNVPVVFTHHVYRLFCQKGVFNDRQRAFCEGPLDLHRCAGCYQPGDPKKLIFAAKLRSNPLSGFALDKLAFPVYRAVRKLIGRRTAPPASVEAPRPEDSPDEASLRRLEKRLANRMQTNVSFLNRYVDMNLCVSEDVQRTLVRFGVLPEKTRVQHIGSLAAERFRSKRHPLQPSEIVIGNIGGMVYYKGTHVLIEALGRLRDRKNWRAHLFGRTVEGYLEELQNIFHDPRIVYQGPYTMGEIDSIVDRVDLMVLASICNDTAPQTIFESFSGSVPIVGPNIGGFPDFIRPGVNGLLFAPGDPKDLAEKLDGLLTEPGRIERMSQRIEQPKTMEKNIEELEAVFDEVLQTRRRIA